MPKLRVEECIDKLNELVEHAHTFLGFALLKQESLFERIDRIRGSLPEDVNEAGRILRRRQDIINNANYEAERIKNDALNEKSRILSESELLRAVQEEASIVREKLIAECEEIKNKAYSDAENIKMQASEEARRMREGAESYAEQLLSTLEANLSQHQAIVQNGQKYLEQKKLDVQKSYGYDSSSSEEYPKELGQEEYARF